MDRLSRQYTVVMLICFAFLVSTKQFVGRPISCWCPAQFTDSHRDYANTVCWVSNTYYLPIERTIPGGRLDEAAAKIGYYQWVPLLLAGQAVLVFLPCQLWRFLCQRSGINLAAIMDAAHVTSDAGYLEVSTLLCDFKRFEFLQNEVYYIYTMSGKCATIFLPVTLPNADRFSRNLLLSLSVKSLKIG